MTGCFFQWEKTNGDWAIDILGHLPPHYIHVYKYDLNFLFMQEISFSCRKLVVPFHRDLDSSRQTYPRDPCRTAQICLSPPAVSTWLFPLGVSTLEEFQIGGKVCIGRVKVSKHTSTSRIHVGFVWDLKEQFKSIHISQLIIFPFKAAMLVLFLHHFRKETCVPLRRKQHWDRPTSILLVNSRLRHVMFPIIRATRSSHGQWRIFPLVIICTYVYVLIKQYLCMMLWT